MNFESKHLTAIFYIILILLGHNIDCSSKIKAQNKFKSKFMKSNVTKTGVDCSANQITNIKGSCLNLNPSGLNSFMPSDFLPAWKVLSQVITNVFPKGPQICFGDFNGSAFDEKEELVEGLCNTIPAVNDGTFGVIGISLSQLPCGQLTDIKICVAFDKCGTFALAFNGGMPTCLSYYGGSFTGIVAAAGAASSLVSDAIANFSVGFSIGRRFSNDIRVAFREGDKIRSGTVTTYGHLFLDLGINLPTDFLTFGKKDLSKYFSLEADILFLADFGDVDTVVSSMINSLKSLKKDDAKKILTNIIKSGAELSLNVDGVLTLSLEELTKGLLSDFSFTLGSGNILISGGSGRSGLESGVYFRLGSNIISDVVNSLQGIFSTFDDIFSKLGFSGFSIPAVGIELGLFLTISALGFQFTFPGFNVKCLFLYDNSKFSCSINAKIFTVIMEGLNFIFKNATKFFDTAGKVIATKAAAEFRKTTKAISEGVKKATGFIKDTSGKLVKIGTEQFRDLRNELEENLKWFKNGYKNAANRAVKVLSETVNIAKKKAELLACDLKYALNKRKRRKCKNKVRDKYNNDSNDKVITCSNNEYRYTTYSDIDNGNIYNLANHLIKCDSSQFLSNFKLERNNSKMTYRYKCITLPQSNSDCYTAKTNSNIVGGNIYQSVDYLDRHEINCKSGYGLKEIQLVKDSLKIYYQYTCCSFPVSSCIDEETANEDYGDKSTVNLEKLLVDAGDYKILSGIKLNSVGDGQFNYSLDSCETDATVITSYDTGCNSDGDGSIFYLDRHNVNCGPGNALNRFQLFRENGTIRYNYYCLYSPQSITTTCTNYTTPVNTTRKNDANNTTHYLDRHDVNCPADSVLTDFKLERSGSRDIFYSYTCCKASVSSCDIVYTSWQDGGNYQNFYLDRQNVDATGTKVLARFKLETSKGNWRYLMRVCTLN